MTDDLTPEQDAVRRLLADARHDGPTPPEVVARLDEVLATLAAERVETHAPVVDLAARRRRTVGTALLAAAAVVVAGVAIGQGLPQMSGDDSGSGSSAGSDMSTSEDQEIAPRDDSDGGADSDSGSAQLAPESLKSAVPDATVPSLSTADPDLDEELLGLQPLAGARRSLDPGDAPDAFCLLGIGPGRRLAAEVDGEPGVVVYKPPSGDAQEVAIFVCGNGEPVRTTFLPLP